MKQKVNFSINKLTNFQIEILIRHSEQIKIKVFFWNLRSQNFENMLKNIIFLRQIINHYSINKLKKFNY